MLKFLKGESTQIEVTEKLKIADGRGGVKDSDIEVTVAFRVPVITSAIQARLLDSAKYIFTAEGQRKFTVLQFKHCIEDNVVTVGGIDIDANELALTADFSHAETAGTIALISQKIDGICFSTEEDEKK